jgi:PKHD-type hydroxylase
MNYLENTYYYWEQGVSHKFCDDVIRFSKTLEKEKGKIGGGHGGPEHLKNNPNVRQSKIIWMSEKWIYRHILPFVHHANRDGKYKFQLNKAEAIQYTRYGSDNHYDWHQDTFEAPNQTEIRKLSICINLTDPSKFEGGDFLISVPNPNPDKIHYSKLNFLKQKGAVAVFPSFTWHKVAPVTKGIRHSLVCWLRGNRFK